jgi:sialic acid synthase SpsE
MRLIARRSLIALNNIKCGEIFSTINIGVKRPGGGLPPIYIEKVIGLTATRDIKKGEKISIGDMMI